MSKEDKGTRVTDIALPEQLKGKYDALILKYALTEPSEQKIANKVGCSKSCVHKRLPLIKKFFPALQITKKDPLFFSDVLISHSEQVMFDKVVTGVLEKKSLEEVQSIKNKEIRAREVREGNKPAAAGGVNIQINIGKTMADAADRNDPQKQANETVIPVSKSDE